MKPAVPTQSIADIRRRQFKKQLFPHLLILACPMPMCDGRMLFTGRSSQQGGGPLINRHVCDRCQVVEEIANDYYPRTAYFDGDGVEVNMVTGRSHD